MSAENEMVVQSVSDESSSSSNYCSLAYSALAFIRMGMSVSAFLQRVRKSW
jgi:hypothetical protein